MSKTVRHEKPLGKVVFQKLCAENEIKYSYADNHHFNYSVDILLPKCEELPSDLDSILTSHPVYLARQVPLGKLVTEEFRCCFMKRGKVHALSYGTSIDSNDCVAILPTGTLILNLTKDTFQELGLEGRASLFGNETQKYVVEINMVHTDFSPGKKFCERVKWCLTDRLNLKFDLLLTWEPATQSTCPTSIQNFFKSNNIVCNRANITKKLHYFKELEVPQVCFSDPENKTEEHCGYLDMYEWLGACAVGADMADQGADNFISSYTCPSPSEVIGSCVSVQYQGMFTPVTVRKALQCLKSYRERKELPWCSITVHGFADSPVTRKLQEHGFYSNGDNLYTYVMFHQGTWSYSALGGRDVYS